MISLLVCFHVRAPKLMHSALVIDCDSVLVPMPVTPDMQLMMLPAGMNYLQSVTPRLALGGEAFWLGQQRKSGTGFAGRFTGDAFVATAQVATTGLVSLTYVQRISEKVRFSLPRGSARPACIRISWCDFEEQVLDRRHMCTHAATGVAGQRLHVELERAGGDSQLRLRLHAAAVPPAGPH